MEAARPDGRPAELIRPGAAARPLTSGSAKESLVTLVLVVALGLTGFCANELRLIGTEFEA